MRWLVLGLCMGVVSACSDEGEADAGGSGSDNSQGTNVGAGGTGAGGAGGAGGTGGTGGTGGSGETGGGGPCLAAPADFTVERSDLCIIERWTANGLSLANGVTPTWGSHDGPLVVSATTTQATLTRWAPGADGMLDATPETFPLAAIPGDAFMGTIAVDYVSRTDGVCEPVAATALAWTGSDFANDGEILSLANGAATAVQATGVFGLARAGNRLFYTGLSAVDAPTNNNLALYAAGTIDCDATLLDDGIADAAFGIASGPVTGDADGNLFAVMSDYLTGSQKIRGYRAQGVPGALPLESVEIATLNGFGDALAAVAPDGGLAGYLAFQPTGADFMDGDVLAIDYTTAGGSLQPGAASTLLTLTTPGTNVVLFTDATNRLWVGVEGATATTFHVLTKAP